jgi:hypothetical protein
MGPALFEANIAMALFCLCVCLVQVRVLASACRWLMCRAGRTELQGAVQPDGVPPSVEHLQEPGTPVLLRLPVAVHIPTRLDWIILPPGCAIIGLVRDAQTCTLEQCLFARPGDEVIAVSSHPRKTALLRATLEQWFRLRTHRTF